MGKDKGVSKGCRGNGKGEGREREGWGRPPALLPPLASASNTTLVMAQCPAASEPYAVGRPGCSKFCRFILASYAVDPARSVSFGYSQDNAKVSRPVEIIIYSWQQNGDLRG